MIDPNRRDEALEEEYSGEWSHLGGGSAPSAAAFLASHPDASPEERLDVLLTDQLLRWRRGCPKSVGEYLGEHPTLNDDPEAVLKLVEGEFLARLEREEVPDPAIYMRMFPNLAEEIRLQCEVDQWLTIPSPPGSSMARTVDYRFGDTDQTGGREAGSDPSPRQPAAEGTADDDCPLRESDFQPMRLLGSGGMGEVYEAIQKSLRRRVALKLIRREALDSPSRVRRFLAEARALARLHHPHSVGVHGIGKKDDGRFFLVMDLVEDGTTLAAPAKGGLLPFDRAAELVATVAEAIEHAHARGVIHRDLKPSNVLLDSAGHPHVTDFGLAKVFDTTDPDNPPTTADQILGTPHYMAPEQADPARGPITPRTDVYALGGLLYALLTGQPPIQGDSLTAILTQVVSPDPVATPRTLREEVPAGLERICLTCLEKDADHRYASAGAVREALQSWLANPAPLDAQTEAAGAHPGTSGTDKAGPGRNPRQDWAPDRTWKGDRRTPNPGLWRSRPATADARPRAWRRLAWTAGAGTSLLILFFLTVVPDRTRDEADRESPHSVARSWANSEPALGLPGPKSVEAPSDPPVLAFQEADGPPAKPDGGEASEKIAERERLLRQRLALQLLKAQSVQRPEIAITYDQLGVNLAEQGKYQEAESLFREALADRLKELGTNHPDIATSYTNLAAILARQGRLTEAETLLLQAVDLRLKELGTNHPLTLKSHAELAAAKLALSRHVAKASADRPQVLLHEVPRTVTIDRPERVEKSTTYPPVEARADVSPPPAPPSPLERIARESNRPQPKREISPRVPDGRPGRLVDRSPTVPTEPGQLHVLALCVGAYDRNRLPYARRDAEQLSEVLNQSRLDAGGRRGLRMVLADADVSAANVDRAFDRIARQTEDRPHDTVVVFLAGHTAVLAPHGFCLLLSSYPFPGEAPSLAAARKATPDAGPAAQIDPRFVLPFSVVARNLARLKALNRLMIVDACQAEAILDDPQVRAIQKGMEGASGQARASYLLVVRRGEPVLEVDPLGHGLFTYTLLRGMGAIPMGSEPPELAELALPRDADFDKDGVVSTSELAAYAEQVLPRLAVQFPQVVASRRGAVTPTEGPVRTGPRPNRDPAPRIQSAGGSFPLIRLGPASGR